MKNFHPHARRRRAQGALAFLILLLGGLILTFFRVQVVRTDTWALRSESNRLRPLALPAPRGTIYDRDGRIIADNVPAYSLSLLPAPLDSIRSRLNRLQPHLGLAEDRVAELLDRARAAPRQSLTVTQDASFDEISAVEERRHDFPGIFIDTRPRRRYVGGSATAHSIGYVGEVTTRELESPPFSDYEQGMVVGKAGVEREYEQVLQGTRGVRYVEVDATGRVVGSFRGVAETPARKGGDLRLNLDLELQNWVQRIFPDTMRGAVVALNVEDGGVLALYSSPGYDPNAFVGGIAQDLWTRLNEDPARPLYNRAVMGLYPPASTWKLASAAIGLELGVVTPDEEMEIPCTGGMQYGNRYFRCWKPEGHGFQDLVGAIRHSCDVYFYQLGLRIGLDRLLEQGTRIGFSRRCGVDLPQESRGVFPSEPAFWERRFGYRPNESETLSLAIGQGPNSQTPLKMAQFYVALARNGSAPAPSIARERADTAAGWSLDLSRESLGSLREGLRRVLEPGGTAYLSSLEHWDLMGKTGTGQNPPNPDHAWFAGMAGPPGQDPEIVVVALVEFGKSGSGTAAPLVAKTADFYLRRKYDVPVDTIQTLGEHYRTGTPAPWAGERARARARAEETEADGVEEPPRPRPDEPDEGGGRPSPAPGESGAGRNP